MHSRPPRNHHVDRNNERNPHRNHQNDDYPERNYPSGYAPDNGNESNENYGFPYRSLPAFVVGRPAKGGNLALPLMLQRDLANILSEGILETGIFDNNNAILAFCHQLQAVGNPRGYKHYLHPDDDPNFSDEHNEENYDDDYYDEENYEENYGDEEDYED